MSASLAISSTRGALASSSWRPSSSSINGGINGAGSTSNLAVAATSVSLSRQPLLRRRQKQKQTLLVAASLVGFNRPSPPWPSSMRGSPSFPARELDNGTRRRSSQQQPLFESIHHVGLLVSNLENSLKFYQGVLGLSLNKDRPDSKLPYRGAWLWVGRPEDNQMIHLMELPSPDPTEGRPAHGGRDRHFCVSVRSVDELVKRLNEAEIPFTLSASGRKAVFYRDPDSNVIECAEMGK